VSGGSGGLVAVDRDGLVAVDRDGSLALPFNCAGMYRGYVTADGIVHSAIYDEPYRSP
jgi:L-asparaginase / beta-aspartyl-peptidase